MITANNMIINLNNITTTKSNVNFKKCQSKRSRASEDKLNDSCRWGHGGHDDVALVDVSEEPLRKKTFSIWPSTLAPSPQTAIVSPVFPAGVLDALCSYSISVLTYWSVFWVIDRSGGGKVDTSPRISELLIEPPVNAALLALCLQSVFSLLLSNKVLLIWERTIIALKSFYRLWNLLNLADLPS